MVLSPSGCQWAVEVWEQSGDIASNIYIGPFRVARRAEEYAEQVRHAFGELLDARVVELESSQDSLAWLRLRDWFDRSAA